MTPIKRDFRYRVCHKLTRDQNWNRVNCRISSKSVQRFGLEHEHVTSRQLLSYLQYYPGIENIMLVELKFWLRLYVILQLEVHIDDPVLA